MSMKKSLFKLFVSSLPKGILIGLFKRRFPGHFDARRAGLLYRDPLSRVYEPGAVGGAL